MDEVYLDYFPAASRPAKARQGENQTQAFVINKNHSMSSVKSLKFFMYMKIKETLSNNTQFL